MQNQPHKQKSKSGLKRIVVVGTIVLLFLVAIRNVLKRTDNTFEYLPKVIAEPMNNAIVNDRLNNLHPSLIPRVKIFLQRAMDELGMTLTIPKDGHYRSFAEQNALYAKGRTTAGKIVTKARGGDSWHNYGLAVDVVEVSPDYGYNSGYDSKRWEKIIALGIDCGLIHPLSWDKPHFQLPVMESRQSLKDAVIAGVPFPMVTIV